MAAVATVFTVTGCRPTKRQPCRKLLEITYPGGEENAEDVVETGTKYESAGIKRRNGGILYRRSTTAILPRPVIAVSVVGILRA